MKDRLALVANENPLPETFNCLNCHSKCQAACCTLVPLDPKLIKRNEKRIQSKIIKFINFCDSVVPITESGKCPFLTKDLKCAIYKWRPPICRLFGTEIDGRLTCFFQDRNGRIRPDHETKKLAQEIELDESK